MNSADRALERYEQLVRDGKQSAGAAMTVPDELRQIAREAFAGRPRDAEGGLALPTDRNPWRALDDALEAFAARHEQMVLERAAETYPHPSGDVTVLGPEIFTDKDGDVICWKGVNYVPQVSAAGIEAQIRAKVAEETLPQVEIDIRRERERQAKRFPPDHPDGTGWDAPLRIPSVLKIRAECRGAFGRGEGTWLHVLVEEVGEVSDADKPQELRAELIQVAAVAQAWVEAIDCRGEHDGNIARGES